MCTAVGAFLKFPEAVETPGTDTGLYATYGQMVLAGARPYVDFWDVHPPLVFGYWALVERLTGSTDWSQTCFAIPGMVAQSCVGSVAHALDLLLSVATALVVARITRQLGGSRAVAALAAVLVVGFADQWLFSIEGPNPSKLTLLPSAIAVWAYLRSQGADSSRPWAVVAGLAAAIAVFAKQPALLTLMALCGHALWRRDYWRCAAVVLAAGAGFVGVCGVLAMNGSLRGFIDQVWIYNVERILVGYFQNPAKPPTITLVRVFTDGGGMLVVLASIGGCVLAVRPAQKRQRFFLWWAACALPAVLLVREYVYIVPAFAALGAFGIARLWTLGGGRAAGAKTLITAVCLLAVWPSMGFQRTQFNRALFERVSHSGPSQPEALGLILRNDVEPSSLFVYGNAAQMYALSNRPPATPYLNAEAWRSTAPGAAHTRANLVAQLRRTPPGVILLAPHSDEAELTLAAYPSMQALLDACYQRTSLGDALDANWTMLLSTGAC